MTRRGRVAAPAFPGHDAGGAQAGSAALRERALALLAQGQPVPEEELLAHVYAARVPGALRAPLVAPLLADPRFTRHADGTWGLAPPPAATQAGPASAPFVALAVAASGPRPSRDRLLAVAAVRVDGGAQGVVFSTPLRAQARVPRYVLDRLGIEADQLETAPEFDAIAARLAAFFAECPVVAQQAELAWEYMGAEMRRIGLAVPACPLVDLNRLADDLLDLPAKPTLATVARACGLGTLVLRHVEAEARAVARVAHCLFAVAQERGIHSLDELAVRAGRPGHRAGQVLRRTSTLRALPDTSGVYVLRGDGERALYVGKARRLRERLAAYVSRPLGQTRRLEGLPEATTAVESDICATDLEALVLEERRIRELQPRFNTQRGVREGRRWIRLPPEPAPTRRSRPRAPPRLELADGRSEDGGAYLGPFRNAHLAACARDLARALFQLDRARRELERPRYRERLHLAWRFLGGAAPLGVEQARAELAASTAARDYAAVRRWSALLARARAFEPASLVLPADPRESRYAVVRPRGRDVEGFVLDWAILVSHARTGAADLRGFGARLLAEERSRTEPSDAELALRWLGGQRPTARLVHLAGDAAAQAAAVDRAARAVAEALLRPAEFEAG